MAIRSAAKSTTGFPPHFLLFSREMRLPEDLYYNLQPGASCSATESVANLRKTLVQVHETVRVVANMEHNQKRQKDCYDRRAYGYRFDRGHFVWMVNKKPELLLNKFHDRWLGPFKVIKRCSDLVYEIQDQETGKSKRVHFNLLKPARRENALNENKTNQADGTGGESSEEEVLLTEAVLSPTVVGGGGVDEGAFDA